MPSRSTFVEMICLHTFWGSVRHGAYIKCPPFERPKTKQFSNKRSFRNYLKITYRCWSTLLYLKLGVIHAMPVGLISETYPRAQVLFFGSYKHVSTAHGGGGGFFWFPFGMRFTGKNSGQDFIASGHPCGFCSEWGRWGNCRRLRWWNECFTYLFCFLAGLRVNICRHKRNAFTFDIYAKVNF